MEGNLVQGNQDDVIWEVREDARIGATEASATIEQNEERKMGNQEKTNQTEKKEEDNKVKARRDLCTKDWVTVSH